MEVKKGFLKTIIITSISILAISSYNGYTSYAEWRSNDENGWSWNENGQPVTGWKIIGDKWYNFNNDGIMQTGWLKDNDKWYMLSDDGSMKTGWYKDSDNKWYYLSDNGIMQSGWKEINEKWYHFSDSGIMDTGWKSIDGKWYYMNSSGQMETGTLTIDGTTYDFSSSGVMLDGSSSSADSANVSSDSNENAASVIEKTKVAYVNTNGGTLNVRSAASSSADILGRLSKGTEITVDLNEENGFYKINYNNANGWVSAEWVSFDKPSDLGVVSDESESSADKKPPVSTPNQNVSLGGIRTTAPSLDDEHYYSNENIFYKAKLSPPFKNSAGSPIRGNCTWYAWGRAWEITGQRPVQANFTGNAYEWWQANKFSGKFAYGSEPKVGAIAVWKAGLPGSGGCGHVAIVEKIENGKVYISESMWHGDCFAYKEIYETSYLYGYIYLDQPNY